VATSGGKQVLRCVGRPIHPPLAWNKYSANYFVLTGFSEVHLCCRGNKGDRGVADEDLNNLTLSKVPPNNRLTSFGGGRE
jgi:hypothetical protein